MDGILNSFRLQETLNPELWDNHTSESFDDIHLKSEVRTALLLIAKEFVDSFDADGIEVEDVHFVGSLANYNWSKFSDVDLHVLIDKKALGDNSDIVNSMFDAKKELFNLKHEIKIKGFDVELYGQDISETVESSVYSVLYDKWIKTPKKETINFDRENIIKKIKQFNKEYESILNTKDDEKRLSAITKLRDKIKNYRKTGLSLKGEFSNENIVFKYLRRSGLLEKLIDLKYKTKDSLFSVTENEF